MSTETTPDAKPSRTRAERIGRRIGVTVFWCLAVFFVGMSTYSVVGQLYGATVPHSARGPEAKCASELESLERTLFEVSADVVRSGDDKKLSTKLRKWDNRFQALAGKCGELAHTWQELGELRASVATMLRNFGDDQATARKRIQQALDAVTNVQETQGKNPT
jgi:hypothetical protein